MAVGFITVAVYPSVLLPCESDSGVLDISETFLNTNVIERLCKSRVLIKRMQHRIISVGISGIVNKSGYQLTFYNYPSIMASILPNTFVDFQIQVK